MRHETHIEIRGRRVGPGSPALVIAEVAQAHDGSLGMAHAFIEAAAAAGADAIKFQTHIAAAESTIDEPFRVKFSRQDATRYDYWRRMEFTADQWHGLAEHARAAGLIFLSSAFSVPAVELLARIGVPAWKVGSGEFRSTDILQAMAGTGLPVLYSTGMAGWAEIDAAADWFRTHRVSFALLQCTSSYPTALEEVGLNVLKRLRAENNCPVGLSDHSGSIYPALAAISRNADIVEVHVTFDRRMFGPDVAASVTFEELATLCRMRDAVAIMDTHPVDKDAMAAQLDQMRVSFGKSLAPVSALAGGTILEAGMLAAKKPAGGVPPEAIEQVVGRQLAHDVDPARILRWEDLVEEDA